MERSLNFRKKLGMSDVVSAWEFGSSFVLLDLFGFGYLTEQVEGGTIAVHRLLSSEHRRTWVSMKST
jgi:hypothetical protein